MQKHANSVTVGIIYFYIPKSTKYIKYAKFIAKIHLSVMHPSRKPDTL